MSQTGSNKPLVHGTAECRASYGLLGQGYRCQVTTYGLLLVKLLLPYMVSFNPLLQQRAFYANDQTNELDDEH